MNNKFCPEFKADTLLLSNTFTRKMATTQPTSFKKANKKTSKNNPDSMPLPVKCKNKIKESAIPQVLHAPCHRIFTVWVTVALLHSTTTKIRQRGLTARMI